LVGLSTHQKIKHQKPYSLHYTENRFWHRIRILFSTVTSNAIKKMKPKR